MEDLEVSEDEAIEILNKVSEQNKQLAEIKLIWKLLKTIINLEIWRMINFNSIFDMTIGTFTLIIIACILVGVLIGNYINIRK